jgi:hypothetical protein
MVPAPDEAEALTLPTQGRKAKTRLGGHVSTLTPTHVPTVPPQTYGSCYEEARCES